MKFMENKKQTAVEWLFRWFNDNQEATIQEGSKAFEQAKEMEKEQVIYSVVHGSGLKTHHLKEVLKKGEEYYNKTYSDDLSDWDVTLMDGLEDEPPYISDDFQIGPDGAYEHTEEFDGADGVCEHTEEFETWDEEYRKMVWNWLKENLESPKTK